MFIKSVARCLTSAGPSNPTLDNPALAIPLAAMAIHWSGLAIHCDIQRASTNAMNILIVPACKIGGKRS